MKKMLVAPFLVSLLAAAVLAAVPQQINYQGQLKNSSGAPLTGTYSIVFTIYDAASSGTNLWSETQSVSCDAGLFNVLLGSVTPIPTSVFSGSNRWLGVQVGSDAEMTPRQQLVSVGNAFQASNADNLGGHPASYFATSAGSTQWTTSGSNIYYNTGKVGIGTASPSYELSVLGGANDGIKITVPDGASNNAQLVLSAGNEPQYGQGAIIQLNAPSSSVDPNALLLYNRTNGPFELATNNSEKLRILASGNVGIGTTAPQTLLSLAKNNTIGLATISSADDGYIVLSSSGSDESARGARISMSGVNRATHGGVLELHAGTTGAENVIEMSIGNSEKLRIDNSGNVGIGTTAPAHKLHASTAAADTSVNIEATDSLNTHFITLFSGRASDDNPALVYSSAEALRIGTWTKYDGTGTWSEKMRITNSGCVGIGTTAPTIEVEIVSATNPALRINTSADNQWYGSLHLRHLTSNKVIGMGIIPTGVGTDLTAEGFNISACDGTNWRNVIIGNNAASAVWFGNCDFSNNPKVNVLVSGSVGIGTTAPGQKLSVAGTIEITSGSGGGLKFADGTIQTTAGGGSSQWTTSGNNIYNSNSGNVGIGTTAPSAFLHINGPTAYGGVNQLQVDDGSTGGFFAVGDGASAGGAYIPSFYGTSAGVNGFGVGFYGRIPAGNDALYGNGQDAAINFIGQRSDGTALQTANILNVRNYSSSLIVVKANGNVGIGTTAPAYKLQLGGTSVTAGGFGGTSATVEALISDTTSGKYAQLALQGPTNGGAAVEIYDGSGNPVADFGMNTNAADLDFINRATSGIMQFYTHNGTSLAPRLYIGSTGNVGIGTTDATSKLSVAGTIEIKAGYGGGLKFADGTIQTTAGGGGSSQWNTSGSDISYSAGSVGIGTTSPATRLDVVSSTNNPNDALTLRPNNQTQSMGLGWQGINASQDFVIWTGGGNERMRILNNGNVGIGTTNPHYNFEVHTGTDQNLQVRSNAYGAGGGILLQAANDANAVGVPMEFGATKFSFNAGNVGIGTAAPGQRLDVNGSSVIGRVPSSGSTAFSLLYDEAGSAFVGFQQRGSATSGNMGLPADSGELVSYIGSLGIYSQGTGYVGFGTGATPAERMRITNPGNVGIGTTAPAATLEVGANHTLVVNAGTGRVGIGTTAPGAPLEVKGDGSSPDVLNLKNESTHTTFNFYNANNSADYRNIFQALRSRGTLASPATVQLGDQLFSITANGYDGAVYQTKASQDFIVDGSVSSGVVPTAVCWSVGNTGAGRTEAMRLTSAGNVGIGTTAPGFTLEVNGYGNSWGWKTNGSDYAEYFENEENIPAGSLVGIDPASGKVRVYREGDEFVGIATSGATSGVVGNSGKRDDPHQTVVGLLGQLDLNSATAKIIGRIVYTPDMKKVGILLSNNKVFVGK